MARVSSVTSIRFNAKHIYLFDTVVFLFEELCCTCARESLNLLHPYSTFVGLLPKRKEPRLFNFWNAELEYIVYFKKKTTTNSSIHRRIWTFAASQIENLIEKRLVKLLDLINLDTKELINCRLFRVEKGPASQN